MLSRSKRRPCFERTVRADRRAKPCRPKTQFVTMLAVSVPLLFFFGLFNSGAEVRIGAVPWWGWVVFGVCEVPLVAAVLYLRATETPMPEPPRHEGPLESP